jgi:DNA-binding NtrC family response regulator
VGLATVRTIAEQADGFLQVDSAPAEGSSFRLYLPALATDSILASANEPQSVVVSAAATILLVEDDDAVRALARQVLRSQGHTVLEAAGAEVALRLAHAHAGTIDLLLTDVVMPEVGGRELAERLALVRPLTRVLYMSGYTDDAVVRHGVREAEVAFLQKPFSIEALTAKVRQVLDAA